jgi:hypothetical protein
MEMVFSIVLFFAHNYLFAFKPHLEMMEKNLFRLSCILFCFVIHPNPILIANQQPHQKNLTAMGNITSK